MNDLFDPLMRFGLPLVVADQIITSAEWRVMRDEFQDDMSVVIRDMGRVMCQILPGVYK